MLSPITTKRFEKDVKLVRKRGKDIKKLRAVMQILLEEKILSRQYLDHKLGGNYISRRECHIEPDWLLIYKRRKKEIIFERTGTHADLFR
ncbi:MAG: type II toxin-antitoxin system YafQ family toxin [Pseudomonadota bacterium]